MTGHKREVAGTGTPPWKSPVALSVLLHCSIIGIALAGWSWSSPHHEPPPRSISARLITQNQPTPSAIVEPEDQPDLDKLRREKEEQLKAEKLRQEQARKKAEQKAKQEAERKAREAEKKAKEAERKRQLALEQKKKQEEARKAEALRKKAEAERKERERRKAEEEKKRQAEEAKRRQQETERKKQEAEAKAAAERKRQEAERRLREQQLQALAEEARRAEAAKAQQQAQAAAAKAREAQMLTESEKYQLLIRERLSQAWYPPPSATEEMTARLQITLLPTGELAGAKLVRSSGNMAFDNSALSAVRSLNRYPVPDERDTFERYFRQFTIEFNPRRLR